MPINPGIYNLQQPVPFNNPFAGLLEARQQQQQQAAQQQEAQQRQQLVDQQIRSGQAQEEDRRLGIDKAKRLQDSTNVINGLMDKAFVQDPQTGIFAFDRGIAEQAIAESGQGHRLPEYLQHFDELDKSTREAAEKRNGSIAKALMVVTTSGNTPGAAQGMVAYLRKNRMMSESESQAVLESLAENDSPEHVAAIVTKYGEQLPQYQDLVRAEETRKGAAAKQVADTAHTTAQTAKLTAETGQIGKPAEPKTLDEALFAAIKAKDGAEQRRLLNAIGQKNAAGRAPTAAATPGPLEKIIGPDGKVVYATREQALGKTPGAGTEKSSSGVQKRVLNFFNRAQQADVELEGFEAEIAKLSTGGQARLNYAPNILQSGLGQNYTAAQRAFTEARLRKDSGAAIPPHEFESDQKTYFAQTGDSKELLEQKRRARAAMLASLAFESGQALGEFLGDPDEAKTVIEGYKTRAAKGGAVKPSAAPAKPAGGIRILKIEEVVP